MQQLHETAYASAAIASTSLTAIEEGMAGYFVVSAAVRLEDAEG